MNSAGRPVRRRPAYTGYYLRPRRRRRTRWPFAVGGGGGGWVARSRRGGENGLRAGFYSYSRVRETVKHYALFIGTSDTPLRCVKSSTNRPLHCVDSPPSAARDKNRLYPSPVVFLEINLKNSVDQSNNMVHIITMSNYARVTAWNKVFKYNKYDSFFFYWNNFKNVYCIHSRFCWQRTPKLHKTPNKILGN